MIVNLEDWSWKKRCMILLIHPFWLMCCGKGKHECVIGEWRLLKEHVETGKWFCNPSFLNFIHCCLGDRTCVCFWLIISYGKLLSLRRSGSGGLQGDFKSIIVCCKRAMEDVYHIVYGHQGRFSFVILALSRNCWSMLEERPFYNHHSVVGIGRLLW